MKKIIVISPSITATHIIKRVTALHQAGFIVEVFAFNRGDGVGGNYPPGVNVTDLGLVPNGKGYVGKFFRATSPMWAMALPASEIAISGTSKSFSSGTSRSALSSSSIFVTLMIL